MTISQNVAVKVWETPGKLPNVRALFFSLATKKSDVQ